MSSVTLAQGELEALIRRALVASNTSEANATSVARALAQAEVDGQKGHGLARVPSYAAQARAGKVDGHARPVVRRSRPGTLLVDVAHGFAYPAIDLALPELARAARECGVGAAGFTRSHHFGVAGHHVERLADEGLVALAFANTPSAMAAWGGRRGVVGTNPIAFAAPRRAAPPLVIDMALSEVARGKIMTAAQKGDPIPAGWALDAQGHPATDAKAALAGTLLPAGGAKGAALAIMVELLAVALTGSNLAFEASSFLDADGPPPGAGQLFVAIDPGALAGGDAFADRVAALAGAIEGDGARLPGSRRLAARAKSAAGGVSVDPTLLATVEAIAASGRLEP